VSAIWEQCNGLKNVASLRTTAWRLVEVQEMTAIRKLVDSFEEYELLEKMIDADKPTLRHELQNLHPLLYTPFRYPPLKHGSRFGSRFEPAIWYGSLNIDGALAEKAYYQFNFLRASKADFGLVEAALTAFSCEIKSSQSIHLEEKPFSKFGKEISSPVSYQASQRLGADMRSSNVEAFTYQSARAVDMSLNVGLFTPKAFMHKKPNPMSFQTWQCVFNRDVVEFKKASSMESVAKIFPVGDFLVNEELPFPAG
jgi:hypothetical protein